MDFRLLYGVVYGYLWFGKWGYCFCSGSFGVEEYYYYRVIVFLIFIFLVDDIIVNFRENKVNLNIGDIVRCYRDMSEI